MTELQQPDLLDPKKMRPSEVWALLNRFPVSVHITWCGALVALLGIAGTVGANWFGSPPSPPPTITTLSTEQVDAVMYLFHGTATQEMMEPVYSLIEELGDTASMAPLELETRKHALRDSMNRARKSTRDKLRCFQARFGNLYDFVTEHYDHAFDDQFERGWQIVTSNLPAGIRRRDLDTFARKRCEDIRLVTRDALQRLQEEPNMDKDH